MRVAAIVLLVSLAARAQVVLRIEAAWHDAESGAVEYAIWTNVPDPTVLAVSLEWRGETVRGSVTRTIASGGARPRDGKCLGRLVPEIAPVPPGRYALVVRIADRQRDDVEEVLAGLERPVVERQVLVGCPSMLVGAVRAEVEQLPRAIRAVEGVVARLGEWVRLAGKGGLDGRGSEYVAWRAAVRADVEAFLEQTAVYRDRQPTAFPETYGALGDLLLNIEDHDELLYRRLAGYAEGNDPQAVGIRDVRRLDEGLKKVASAFVWESVYALLELPGQLAEMAVPAEGLPTRAAGEVWLRDLDRALADYQELVGAVSPRVDGGSLRACGVCAPLSDSAGVEALLRAVRDAIRGSTRDLAELRVRAGGAAQAAPIPVPPELRKSLDALLARDETLRERVRTCVR